MPQTMHVGYRINWKIGNTCQCVHLRMSFERGIYISISIYLYTQQEIVYITFKGHFVGTKIGKVWLQWLCLSSLRQTYPWSRSLIGGYVISYAKPSEFAKDESYMPPLFHSSPLNLPCWAEVHFNNSCLLELVSKWHTGTWLWLRVSLSLYSSFS